MLASLFKKNWKKVFLEKVAQKMPEPETLAKLKTIVNTGGIACPNILGSSSNYSKFIILSRARSGSSRLRSFLQTHPNIACYGELFLKEKCLFNYPFFPNPEDKEIIDLRRRHTNAFLNHFVFHPYLPEIKSVGFKIFYDQLDDSGEGKKAKKYLVDHKEIHIIHLIRKNYLKAFVSFKIARKTDVWAKLDPLFLEKIKDDDLAKYFSFIGMPKKSEIEGPSTLKVAYEDLLHYFESTDKCISDYHKMFSAHLVRVVYYEDFAADAQKQLEPIIGFLGLEPALLYSPMVKQSRGSLRQTIENYDALKQKFTNTRWIDFFEE